MHAILLVLTTFLTAAVEGVEMMTIVLGVGITRGWSSTLIGAGAGLAVLAGIVAVLGPALTVVPIDVLRAAVGILLLLFGLQWLRQSIFMGSLYGFQPKEETVTSDDPEGPIDSGMDWTAFALSFKGVLLEGLEIAFIVVTFGAATGAVGLGALGAVAALVMVAIVGALARRALTDVPETALKLAVGLLLAAYGTFWGAEGLGVEWPGSDLAIVGLLVFYILLSYVYLLLLRRTLRPRPA